MGIHPVQPVLPEIIGQAAEADASPQPVPPTTSPKSAELRLGTPAESPSVGNSRKAETGKAVSDFEATELPQDEVEVQRDSQADGAIVIKYMDASGNVVLQVPSAEVLQVAQVLAENARQAEKALNAPPPTNVGEGEETHGH